ncbi:DUF3822 family protein [Polaribacter sp.]|nr:DUF3822 family protein [Polaribacter sp.]
MTRQMLQTSSTSFIEDIENLKLSIQFSLDGFSFCINNIGTSKKTLFFCNYTFDKSLSKPQELLIEIEKIFKNDSNLQRDFKEVQVIHQNNLATIVPDAYFQEDNLKDYLNYTVKTLVTDFISFDELNSINAKNVYVPFVNINNYLFQNFGEFEYQHHASVLIDKLIDTHASEEKKVFVNVSKTTFDLIVIEGKELLLYNNFNYTSKEDFLYYILFVAEQLNIAPENATVYLLGEISKESDLYEILYNYIKNVEFIEINNPVFDHLNLAKHSNFILLA